VSITDLRTGTRAEAVIAGLANAAAFLETHPGLPFGNTDNPLHVSVYGGTDEENRAEVDRIAVILGVAAGTEPGTHYAAVRDFGGGVAYKAVAISRAYADAFDRHMDRFRAGTARGAA